VEIGFSSVFGVHPFRSRAQYSRFPGVHGRLRMDQGTDGGEIRGVASLYGVDTTALLAAEVFWKNVKDSGVPYTFIGNIGETVVNAILVEIHPVDRVVGNSSDGFFRDWAFTFEYLI